jgi:threonine dehydratase
MQSVRPVTLTDIREARERVAGAAIRTPLVRLQLEGSPAQIWLKLENLQPIGSFKLRGAGNAIALSDPAELARGVYTASAGNMAQGVAWNARRLGIPCKVIVPDHAPRTKLEAIARLNAETIEVPFGDWWDVILSHEYPGMNEAFIHPVSDPRVIAGNGTIGLEIVEDLPDVDAVIVPYGGGALSCGIATAVGALRPEARVFAAEVATAAPLAASLEAGEPVTVDYTPSFVDGIGGKSVLPEMWPLSQSLLAGSIVTSLEEVAQALRLLVTRNRVVAEGAAAAAVAAALTGRAGSGNVVAVVSGGNIDLGELTGILQGRVPSSVEA